jgi:hypothetical protein
VSRYYLIANYLVPPFIRVGDGVVALGMTSGCTAPRRRRLPGPKNFMICRLDASTSARVVYYDWERGLLMITAPSRQRAYDVGEAVNGYFSAFLGYEQDPSRTSFWLRECERLPKADWSEKALLENLPHLESKEPEHELHELHELQSGFGLDYHHVDLLGRYLPALTESPRLVNALLHFRQSRQLFAGFMVGPALIACSSYGQLHQNLPRRCKSSKRGASLMSQARCGISVGSGLAVGFDFSTNIY